MSGANGHTPDFEELTLPNCGLLLRIRRVSPFLAKDIRKQIQRTLKKPAPPLQEVDYGDGKKVKEPNEAHPDYKAELNEYYTELGDLFLSQLIAFGVECEIDAERVRAFRERAAGYGIELSSDDLVVYVTRVVGLSQNDVRAMQDAILGRIQPTEARTAEAVESFPGQVQGA